jgi:hypothetical protein
MLFLQVERLVIGKSVFYYTWTKQSWKCNRINPAPMPGFLDVALLTASLMMFSACGQERM